MVARFEYENKCFLSNDLFIENATNGLSNLGIYQQGIVRSIPSFKTFKDSITLYSFASELVHKFDQEAWQDFINRNQEEEIINFRSRREGFILKNYKDDDLSIVNGRIVILGFMGDSTNNHALEDSFFTPLKLRTAYGAVVPDSSGPEIHANVVHMILNRSYIDRSSYVDTLFKTLCSILVVALYSFLKENFKAYSIISRVITGFLIFLSIFISVLLYKYAQYKLDTVYLVLFLLISYDGFKLYERYAAKAINALSPNKIRLLWIGFVVTYIVGSIPLVMQISFQNYSMGIFILSGIPPLLYLISVVVYVVRFNMHNEVSLQNSEN
jgi:hypothetical protein